MEGHSHSKLASLQNVDQDDREWLRQEAKLVAQHLSKVNSTLNSFLPIYRLPEEIIVYVFEIIAASSLSNSRWINFTHVCRLWRNIALNRPTLWRRIYPSRGADLATESVKRSGCSLPLELFWRNTPPVLARMPSEFPDLSTDAVRTRVIVQDVEVQRSFFIFYSVSCVSGYPALEHLSLRAPGNAKNVTTITTVLALELLTAPEKLSYLSLRFIGPSPFSSIGLCKNLRTLRLVRFVNPDQQISLGSLLQVLEQCCLLQNLLLVDVDFDQFDEAVLQIVSSHGRKEVRMDHLQSLTVALPSGSYIAHLLGSLVMPHVTHVHLQNRLGPDDDGLYPLLPSDDPFGLELIKPLRRLELKIRHAFSGVWYIKGFHSDPDCGMDVRCSTPPNLQIISGDVGSNYRMIYEYSSIFRAMHLDTLLVESDVLEILDSKCDWKQLLTSFHSIKNLKLSYCAEPYAADDLDRYLEALSSPYTLDDSSPNTPAGYIPLPALTSLHLIYFRKSQARRLRQNLYECARFRQSILPQGQHFQLVVNGKVWKIPKVSFII